LKFFFAKTPYKLIHTNHRNIGWFR